MWYTTMIMVVPNAAHARFGPLVNLIMHTPDFKCQISHVVHTSTHHYSSRNTKSWFLWLLLFTFISKCGCFKLMCSILFETNGVLNLIYLFSQVLEALWTFHPETFLLNPKGLGSQVLIFSRGKVFPAILYQFFHNEKWVSLGPTIGSRPLVHKL